MALANQPMFQQEMLKQHSKDSMRGQRTNRTRSRGIQTRLHEMDLARKSAFAQLGLSKKRSDLSHKGRLAQYRLDKENLDQRKKTLPWQIGIGGGVALLSGLEGKRQADLIRAQAERQKQQHDRIMSNEDAVKARYWESMVWPHRNQRSDPRMPQIR